MRPIETLCRVAALAVTIVATGAAFAQATPDQPPTQPSPPSVPSASPAASADGGKALVQLAFTRADADKDGRLSPAEANVLPAVAAKFAQLDTNSDGFISQDEFTIGVRVGN